MVRRRGLGKHADDDSKEPRDLWHCRPPSLDKAALSLAMGNALTSVDFARSAVAFGVATAVLYSPRYLSHSADSLGRAKVRLDHHPVLCVCYCNHIAYTVRWPLWIALTQVVAVGRPPEAGVP